ncbi:sensor histidine kinase [Salinisphaera sp. Q1T1-3]|uniref:ATP-binding protein n=1 Tax=Salinisphaera sp. Q1T1-3 TaxID=2321229 RepID=UPI000E70C881|nr:sensor histidine kinase [Salinisphaera sp. Q1T1-3]RJS95249.1 sensor histidine kinase [Salinisphaera sp. Q1T1-3]
MTPWSKDNVARAGHAATRRISLAGLTGIWAFGLVVASLGVAWLLFSQQLWQNLQSSQGQRVENIAQTVARLPSVVSALAAGAAPDAQAPIQGRIESLRRGLDVDFIVVMNKRAIRLTHTKPARIGHHFRGGDEPPALAGSHYVSIARGTLGRSVRGFAPVRAPSGAVIGAVSVGVTLSALAPLEANSRTTLIGGLLLVVCLGGAGALLLARQIKQRLMDMEPDDIAALVAEHQAMLDAVHEGLIVVDMQQRLRLINPAARRLLARGGTPAPEIGEQLTDPRPHGDADTQAVDGPLVIGDQRFRGTLRAMGATATPVGCVISFRDTAELQRLGEELTGARRYAQALRAAQHDTKNRLHVVLGLVETGDIDALARYVRTLIALRIDTAGALAERIDEPTLGGFVLGKHSEADELGVALSVQVEHRIPPARLEQDIHRVVSVMGNLIDNAFDAVADRDTPKVALTIAYDADTLSIAVQDNGHGMDPATLAHSRQRGYSSHGADRGLGLYLVDRQVTAADGELALYSTPGQGTLVEVVLPYAGDCAFNVPNTT